MEGMNVLLSINLWYIWWGISLDSTNLCWCYNHGSAEMHNAWHCQSWWMICKYFSVILKFKTTGFSLFLSMEKSSSCLQPAPPPLFQPVKRNKCLRQNIVAKPETISDVSLTFLNIKRICFSPACVFSHQILSVISLIKTKISFLLCLIFFFFSYFRLVPLGAKQKQIYHKFFCGLHYGFFHNCFWKCCIHLLVLCHNAI